MLPAYAGMIRGAQLNIPAVRRAPRVCGDDPALMTQIGTIVAVLPAYAGMIRETSVVVAGVTGAPRVCGDDPKPSITY